MNRVFTLLIFLLTSLLTFAQDDINQLIIANGGQFGNPSEQTNLAAFDPVAQTYNVFDTIPTNSVQDILIEGDYAYVAAQSFLVKYDLDTYERLAIVDFPGVSAHQLAIYEDKLLATNFFAQSSDNLYVFDKSDLSIIDTVQEITDAGGTMAIVGDKLFIGQNLEGSTDACPPFGCLNDTLGYLAEVDLITNQWLRNITLNNNGVEVGRLLADDAKVYTLNQVSNTVTTYTLADSQSVTETIAADIKVSKYRNEAILQNDKIVSLFDGGISSLSTDLQTLTTLVDTPAIAFAFDYINDNFYITATDFFSFTNAYSFSGGGEFQYDIPVGFAPEALAIHYNSAPIGASYNADSEDTVIIVISDFVTDPDGDSLIVEGIQTAPASGVVSVLENGNIMYRSLSPGSGDNFTVNICDNKLNALCSFIQVDINDVTAIQPSIFEVVSVYPNPVANQLLIRNAIEGANYEIYSALGQIVKTTSNASNILVEDLPSGSYFLRMNLGSDVKTIHFYKN